MTKAGFCPWLHCALFSSFPSSVNDALATGKSGSSPIQRLFSPPVMARGIGQFRHSQLWRMFFGFLNFILSTWGLKLSSGVFQICKCNIIVINKFYSIVHIFPLLYKQMKGIRNSWRKYNVDIILKVQRKLTLTPLSLSSRWWKPLNDIFSPYHLWQCNSSVFWMTRMFHSTEYYTQCCTILNKMYLAEGT